MLSALLGLSWFAWAAAAEARPNRRQSDWGKDDGAGNVVAKWQGAAVNAGDLIIAAVTYSGGTSTTVTPPAGWTLANRADNGTNVGVAVYYAENCPAKARFTTETFTVSPATDATVQLDEFTGVVTSGSLDVFGTNTGNTSPASVSDSTAPDSLSELSYVIFGVQSASSTLGTPTGGFSNINSTGTPPLANTATPSSTNTKSRPAFSLLTGAGTTVSTTMTETGPTTNWAAVSVTFRVKSAYWIGGGGYPARPGSPDPTVCYGHFDDDGCWSSNSGGLNDIGAPDLTDVVIFDGGGTGDCTMDPLSASAEQAYSLEVDAGYTGTITKVSQDLWLQSHFTLSGGTFNGGSGLTIETDMTNGGVLNGTYNGNLAINGGSFNTNGAVIKVRAATITGGTVNVTDGAANPDITTTQLVTQSGGTVNLNAAQITMATGVGNGGAAFTLTGGTFNAGTGTVNVTRVTLLNGTGVFNGAGATETLSGALNVTAGTLNLGAATLTGATTVGATGTLNVGAAGVTFPTSLAISGGTVNAGTGSVSVTTTTSLTSSGTLHGNTATVTFGQAVTVTSGTLDLATAASTFSTGNTQVLAGSMTLGAGTVTLPGTLTVRGTFNAGSGSVTVSGNTTVDTGGVFNANSSTLAFTGTVNVGAAASSGTFNANTATVTFNSAAGNSLRLQGGSTFNGNTAHLTFGPNVPSGTTAVNVSNGNMDLSTATPTFAGAGNVSVGATSTLTVGASGAALPGALTVTGTLTSGSGLVSTTTTLTINAGGTVSVGTGGLTVGTSMTDNGTLNAGSGTIQITTSLSMTTGTFNAQTSHTTITTSTTLGTTSVFNGNTAIITFGPSVGAGQNAVTVTSSTMDLTNATPTFGGSGDVTVQTGSTFTLGASGAAFPGALVVNGSTFNAGSGTVTATGGTTTVQNSAIFNGNTAIINFGAVNFTSGTMALTTARPTFGGAATVSGTMNLGGTVAFNSTLNVSGGTFNANASTITFANTVTVSTSGAFNGNTATLTFNGVADTSGTMDLSTAGLTFNSGTVTVGASGIMTMGAGTVTFPSTLTVNGTFNAGSGQLTISGTTTVQNGGTFNGATATLSFAAVTVSSGSMSLVTAAPSFSGAVTVSGGALTLGAGTTTLSTTLTVSGGTFSAGTGTVNVTGNSSISGTTGVINANTSTLNFNGTMTLGSGGGSPTPGTFNANSATVSFNSTTLIRAGSTLNANSGSLTFVGAVTMQASSFFNGNTGSGTFQAAPTLTSGTFSVGDAGTAGRYTFQQGATFTSGMTLSFPTDKGRLSLSSGKTLTVSGTISAHTGSSSTYPKVDCNGCGAGAGITVAFGGTSTLDVDGLEFDNSVAAGVSAANGATFTTFKRLKFLSNVGGGGSVHLKITANSVLLNAPGCYFDSSASSNVQLVGNGDADGKTRAIFENQTVAANGNGAGESFDIDDDNTPQDGLGDNLATNGAVVEWITVTATDTGGTIEGFPSAAFDWNTFTWYGVYVAYKDFGGAGTADRIFLRSTDGSAGYYYDVAQSKGDIIGTPRWDSLNEQTVNLDVDGNGTIENKSVHVVYIPTTGGHIIKLIDSGTTLAPPPSGAWSSDFTDASVASISSPLVADASNLYFGGTDASSETRIFGVQIAGGAGEKTLVKSIGSVGAISAAPSLKTTGGKTYLFLGSKASAGQAYIYRVEVVPGGIVDASCTSPTHDVNGSVRLINSVAYAADSGGVVHAIDALNFNTGGFTNVAGFPYQTTAAANIAAPPYIDAVPSGLVYFGDDAGKLYALKTDGTLYGGYPIVPSSGEKLSASPLYRNGVIAVGSDGGYVYFIDQHDGTGNPALFNRYFVGTGTVSSVAWNASTSQYMVATTDGKLVFIPSQTDPTPASN